MQKPEPGGWRRRHCLSAMVGLGGTLVGIPAAARPRLTHPQDFAAVLDLRTGALALVLQPDQAARIRAQPGSTVKLAVAAAALESGVTNPGRRIACPGWYTLPRQTGLGRIPCWDSHGELTLQQAIARSCNVHFYALAAELGTSQVLAGMQRFGFSPKIGLAPLLATGQDPDWRVDVWQMLGLAAAVGLRGKQIRSERGVLPALDLKDSTWDLLWAGMAEAATTGTGRGIAPEGVLVAAKTGTILKANVSSEPLWADDFQSWVLAFWPLPNPSWAMVLHLHQGKAYQAGIRVARRLIAWVTEEAG